MIQKLIEFLKRKAAPARTAEPGPLDAKIRAIAALLPDLAPERARILVAGTIRDFARWVGDLPASEKHHHSQQGGLLDHSLEVALFAVQAAYARYFVTSTGTYPEFQEFRLPRLRYMAYFLGLTHDIGKILSVEVRGPNTTLWNAFEEPLADFQQRHGREQCTMSWRVGRGKRRHEILGEYLLARFLTTGVVQYVGPKLLIEVLERETPAAEELYEIVNEADVKSASCAVEVGPVAPRKEESSPQKLTTDNLIENIRTGIREKWIPINEWHSAGYVVGDITYLALPRLIECLTKRGIYRADPKNRINVQSFVDAFSGVSFVRKRPDGSVKRSIRMDKSRPSFQAVALQTVELFQATDVPQWGESGIHEDPNHA